MFERLGRAETNVDRAARQMVEAIVGGRLASGGRLPPERKLAETFGINRGTLRSALNRLGAWGLVEARQGAGYRILDFRRHGGPALLSVWLKSITELEQLEVVFSDLLAIRRALANVVVGRIQSTDTQAIQTIENAVQSFMDAANNGADESQIAELDLAVIGAILDAAGSVVFRLFLNPISDVLYSFSDLRSALYRNPQENVTAYHALLHAVKNSDDKLPALVNTLLEQRDKETLDVWKQSKKGKNV
jgi:GntR family transcriptional regulator, transcriptional repressor for pyruvate dehydrogenase complex